jgi:hypothetical protein
MFHRCWYGMVMSLSIACSVPDLAYTRTPDGVPPADGALPGDGALPDNDAQLGDDAAACQPACASFSTLRTCPAGAPDVTCSGATPICRAATCVAVAEVSFADPTPVFDDDSAAGFGLVDVNADGHLDLVAALAPANATGLRIGNGDRTFLPATEISLRRALFFRDLNGDGRADLLVQTSAPSLDAYLGDGTGQWTARQPGFTTTASAASTGKLADLDEDGAPDFVFVSSTSVVIHHGRGDGTFEPAIGITTVSAAEQVVIGDVDGDGHPDLAVRENAGSIETFRRTAARSYANGVLDTAVAATDLMAIADFDGDGKADLVTTTAAKDKLVVVPGNGDGTFGAPVATAASAMIRTLVVGDVNGDGVPDVAIVQPFDATDQTILAFVGRGDGTFKIVTTSVRDIGIRAAIQAVDLARSGRTDIFYMSSSNGAVRMIPSL